MIACYTPTVHAITLGKHLGSKTDDPSTRFTSDAENSTDCATDGALEESSPQSGHARQEAEADGGTLESPWHDAGPARLVLMFHQRLNLHGMVEDSSPNRGFSIARYAVRTPFGAGSATFSVVVPSGSDSIVRVTPGPDCRMPYDHLIGPRRYVSILKAPGRLSRIVGIIDGRGPAFHIGVKPALHVKRSSPLV